MSVSERSKLIELSTSNVGTFAATLFDQQLWCWGWDVRCERGNQLIEFGFQRTRCDEGRRSSYYSLNTRPNSIALWAFGVMMIDSTAGAILVDRSGFRPRYYPMTELPVRAHRTSDLGNPAEPESDRTVIDLTVRMMRWCAAYERWIDRSHPAEYRQAALEAWRSKGKRCCSTSGETASHWHMLADHWGPVTS